MKGCHYNTSIDKLTLSIFFTVDDSWLPVPEKDAEMPVHLYFNEVKFSAWSKNAEYIQVGVTITVLSSQITFFSYVYP